VIRLTQDLDPLARAAHDTIIDVRSPSEFAEDHLPGAINLPVLDDAQRAEVGTLFVQKSKFLARRIGAALVARNIADHLDGALAESDGAFQPLVYCWRGGQRSTAMATVMDQVGWRVSQLEGGYQTWRRQVVSRLYDPPLAGGRALSLILLDGLTGVGKTDVLARLRAHGVQTLDLEALAGHRGSVFGALPDPQPSQKLFESRLAVALESLDLTQPIVAEAESSRIGDVTLPPRVWAAMKAASCITLTASVDVRADLVLDRYAAVAADPEALDRLLARMPRHHGRETLAGWRAMAAAGELKALAVALMTDHYDPAYRRGADPCRQTLAEIEVGAADDAALESTASRVAEIMLTQTPKAGQARGCAAE
jgi:tRNA 2-selenouridine synthase